jgi:hypothetical protein
MTPLTKDAPAYNYRFTVCPDDQWGYGWSVAKVFEAVDARLEMRLSEDDFERFRLNLSHNGFLMRDVERTACVEPTVRRAA